MVVDVSIKTRNADKILVRKPQGKIPLTRLRRREEVTRINL
jgi:hypothetical protein